MADIVAMRDCEDGIADQVAVYQKRRDVPCDGLRKMDWDVEPGKAGMFKSPPAPLSWKSESNMLRDTAFSPPRKYHWRMLRISLASTPSGVGPGYFLTTWPDLLTRKETGII